MGHNAAWPRAKAIDWSRINPLAKDYDLFLMHNLEVSHIRLLIGLSAGDYVFSQSFLSLAGFMLFPLTQCRPQLGPSVFLYFPTMCLNQMSNTCSAANIITANLLSHKSRRLPFPKRFPPLFSLSPLFSIYTKTSASVYLLSQLCKGAMYQSLVFSLCEIGNILLSFSCCFPFHFYHFILTVSLFCGAQIWLPHYLITTSIQCRFRIQSSNLFTKKQNKTQKSNKKSPNLRRERVSRKRSEWHAKVQSTTKCLPLWWICLSSSYSNAHIHKQHEWCSCHWWLD